MSATLFLPSLSKHKESIIIANLNKSEAEVFLDFWETQVVASRKLQVSPANPTGEDIPAMEYFKGSINFDSIDQAGELETFLEKLETSDIKKYRGLRPLFVDYENNEVGVGTTVIYNPNWATQKVSDPSVVATLLQFAAEYD